MAASAASAASAAFNVTMEKLSLPVGQGSFPIPTIVLASIVVAIITASALPLGFSAKKGTLPFPNGPRSLPIIGNLFDLSSLMKDPDNGLLAIAAKYGQLCMLWFGNNPVVIVSSPRVAKDLMDKKGSNFSSRPGQNPFRSKAWPWRLVTTPTGETFRLLRKLYHNYLGPQQSAGFRKYQDFESVQMMMSLLEKPEGFLQDVERFAMSVIFSATYGVRLATLDHPIMVEFYSVWELMLQYFQPGSLLLDFFPFLQYLPEVFQPWLRLAAKLRVRETALHRAFLKTLKDHKPADMPECFGTSLVAFQEEDESITDERACDILAMLIGAGADTTSSYLQSFFKVMALHPEVVAKAQEELDRVVGPNRLPGWDDEYNLPYVRALIKEVHRWAPIGSLGVPHASVKDDTYEGEKIPGGTIVFPNLTALSRSPERYEAPDDFAPERFVGDQLDASSSALHPDFMKRDHFHYGFGRRLCQGIFVAEASLYIVVARTLWAFDVKPKAGAAPLDMTAKIAGLVTKPKPYEVAITPRSAKHEQVLRAAKAAAKTDILDFDSIEFK